MVVIAPRGVVLSLTSTHPRAVTEKTAYWPALDGLRGLAVLLVVADHTGLVGEWANAGYAGVIVFFVLSGFLITHLRIHSTVQGRGRLLEFYASRMVRLWPALLVLSAVVSVIWLAQGRSASSMGIQVLLADFYLEDFFHGRHTGEVLAHTWSLSVEEQFYLLWPFALPFVLRLSHRGRTIALGAAIVASGLIHVGLVLVGAGNQAYASLPANAYALLAGCALALLPLPALRHWAWPVAGLVALAAALFVFPVLPLGDYLAPVGVVGAACVLVVALRWGNVVFASRPARYLGRISYSLYLWHWPLLFLTGTLGQPVAGGLVALGSLLVAAASTHGLEEPLRRAWRRRRAARAAGSAAVGAPNGAEPLLDTARPAGPLAP